MKKLKAESKGVSSARQCFRELIGAMEAGDSEKIRALSTEKGFNSVYVFSRSESREETKSNLQSFGKRCGEMTVSWFEEKAAEATLLLSPGFKENRLKFVREKGGWKLDDWRHAK